MWTLVGSVREPHSLGALSRLLIQEHAAVLADSSTTAGPGAAPHRPLHDPRWLLWPGLPAHGLLGAPGPQGHCCPPPSPGSRGALALAPAAPRPRGASTASVPGAFLLSQQRFWRSRVKPTSRSLFPRARSCLAFSVSCPAFPLHASVPQAHARTREAGHAEAG